jgi:hypothetical protein
LILKLGEFEDKKEGFELEVEGVGRFIIGGRVKKGCLFGGYKKDEIIIIVERKLIIVE